MARPRQNLNVRLTVVNDEDAYPTRAFTLKSPTYAIRVGRGSKSGIKELFPACHNSWFESRVMSREHAVLKADPDTKHFFIEDVGSMHGTYVEDIKIRPQHRRTLVNEDLIRFGAEVTRGPDSFPALEVIVSFHWIEDASIPLVNAPRFSHPEMPRNSFSLQYEADEGENYDDDDDDIEFVQESVPTFNAALPSRTYAIPESDLSSAGSFSEEPSLEPSTTESSEMVSDSACHAGPSGLTQEERYADEKVISIPRSVDEDHSASSILDIHSAAELYRAGHDEHRGLASKETIPREPKIHKPSTRNDRDVAKGPLDQNLAGSDFDSGDDLSQVMCARGDELSEHLLRERARADCNLEQKIFATLDDSNRGRKLKEASNARDLAAEMFLLREGSASLSQTSEIAAAAGTVSYHEDTATELKIATLPTSTNPDIGKRSLERGLTATESLRAPSPSDAAMMKTADSAVPQNPTSSFASMTYCPPNDHRSQAANDTQTYGNSTWPDSGGFWGQSGFCSYPLPQSGFPAANGGRFASSSHPLTRVSNFGYSIEGEMMSTPEYVPTYTSSEGVLNATPTGGKPPSRDGCLYDGVPTLAGNATARRPIKAILETTRDDYVGPGSAHSLKRKAQAVFDDQELLGKPPSPISMAGMANPETGAKAQTQTTDLRWRASTPPGSAAIAHTKRDVQRPEAGAEAIGSPRKRAKIKGARGQLAAATLAGVFVGSIGTIAALLSLPSNFFA